MRRAEAIFSVSAVRSQRTNQTGGLRRSSAPSEFPSAGPPPLEKGAGRERGEGQTLRGATVSAPFRAANHRQDDGRAHAPSSLTVARGRSPDADIHCGSPGQVSGRRPAGSRQSLGGKGTRLGRHGLSRTLSVLMGPGRGWGDDGHTTQPPPQSSDMWGLCLRPGAFSRLSALE